MPIEQHAPPDATSQALVLLPPPEPVHAEQLPIVPSTIHLEAVSPQPASPTLSVRDLFATDLTPLKDIGECPACTSGDARILFRGTDRLYKTTEREFFVVECAKCRLIRLHPQPTPKDLLRYYPADYLLLPPDYRDAEFEQRYARWTLRTRVDFVQRALRESGASGPVLDVGCGNGLFLQMLRQRNLPAIGLDFSLNHANIAWRRNQVPAICAGLTRAPFAPDQFALISMFNVLGHLYDPAAYLESARQLLTANGRLILQVPNASSWQFLLFGENWSGLDMPRQFFHFKEHDLDLLLDSCGFEVLRRTHFCLHDSPSGLATTLAPSLDPVVRRSRRVVESKHQKQSKDWLYFALVFAAYPFTLVEAACRAGSTIIIEARKKP